ncbi:tRNA modification GTPase TrmE [Bradyrhizobium diazoefficiens]|uniref:tRNA modification GTPase TrmE n=1 Tax=Bradyrhizobium diazoefficiens TaxID=1355477 RepID=A0A0E3VU89_9BRAD|nr:tRNA modification GTPase TrmE [Bradyrhizobium diazoefficiens]
MHPRDQTIFALSSGRPPSAIAVVRVSGAQAGLVLTTLAGKLPAPRQASRRLLRDGTGQPIDDAVVLWFPGRQARPVRTSPNSTSMAAAPCWRRSWPLFL